MRKLATYEIQRSSPEEFKATVKTPVILVLDNIRSARNVGSIFRTADAFALQHVYLCGITAQPPSRDIMKTALGADQTVPWTYAKETTQVLSELSQQPCNIFAVEQSDQPIWLQEFTVNREKTTVLVLGNEVTGVEQKVMDLCHGSLEVPQFGTKHSLNVSVCTGLVVWELVRQLKYG
ncbi:MAG: TrmH family RNA methyltransferase [Bacteroidota bacterium]